MPWNLVVIRNLLIEFTGLGVFNLFIYLFLNNVVARQVYWENCRYDVCEVANLGINLGVVCLKTKDFNNTVLQDWKIAKKMTLLHN